MLNLLPYLAAGTLLAAGVIKVARPESILEVAIRLVPRANARRVVYAIATAEIGLAALVVVWFYAGVLAALAWMLGATAILIWTKRSGMACGCFGGATKVGWLAFVRNALIFLGLTVGLWRGPGDMGYELHIGAVLVALIVLIVREALSPDWEQIPA